MSEGEGFPKWTSLAEATTDELVSEMSKRFDAILVAGSVKPTEGKTGYYFNWIGNIFTCIGLAETAVGHMHCELAVDPDDDK